MTKINKNYDNLNHPAGNLFPDLYLTDDAFSKDQNFFYRELNHQQITKIRQREKMPISLILHTYLLWKKQWRALKKPLTQSFLLICSMGIATWMMYTLREGKVNLRTWLTDLFFSVP